MKKKVTKAIELYRMSGTQRVQWAKAVKMQHDIDEMAVIRDNLLRSSTDKAFRDSIKQSFADKIYKAQHELNAYMDSIEATRQKQACLLIATQAICDLACTLSDRFADECKRTSGWSEAGKPYQQMVHNAAHETDRHIKGLADSVLLWEEVVEMIDAPKDNTVSLKFAEVSQWLTDQVTALIEDEMPKKISDKLIKHF